MRYVVDFEVTGTVTLDLDGRSFDREDAVAIVEEALMVNAKAGAEHQVEVQDVLID